MNQSRTQLADEPSYRIIPAPHTLKPEPGYFRLASNTPFRINDEALRGVAAGFTEFVSIATAFEPHVVLSDSLQHAAINFVLRRPGQLPAEGYELTISAEGIDIAAADPAGAYYATQTLRQLLPIEIESDAPLRGQDWSIPAGRITDHPQFTYRGMHLDVSRHFFSAKSVKRFIDLLAAHKLNTFHWHLTDDQGWRIEILKYPRLTEVGGWREETVSGHALGREATMDGHPHGGYYTQSEIRDIVDYASRRFVTIIPEIDLPGHASALLAAYPELSCDNGDYRVKTSFGIFPNVLCPHEKTFEFLADVIGEVAALFPGPYIHIGGDEVITTQWENCESCANVLRANGLADYTQLQGYFVRRLQEIVASLGKKVIGWDDIVDGGADSSATVMAWRGAKKAISAAERGHDVIMSPAEAYFDYYQSTSLDEPMAIHGQTTLRDVYGLQVVPAGLPSAATKRILGAQGNLWSEYIRSQDQLDYMAFPRMSALSEVLWTPAEKRSWEGFLERMPHFFARLDRMGVKASRSVYAVRASTTPIPNLRALKVELNADGMDHRIRYTLDGTRPDGESLLYAAPIVLEESTTVRAVAEDPRTGDVYGDTRLSFRRHKALGCEVSFEVAPDASWGESRRDLIVDGITRTDQIFRHEEWAGFAGGVMNATVDLSAVSEISEVTIGYDSAIHRRLYPPTGLEVFVSSDKKSWHSTGRLDENTIDASRRDVTLRFEPVLTRYVRIVARNDAKVNSAETEDYVSAPLFIDEIVVN